MSAQNLKRIAHLELEIFKINLFSVSKLGNEQTDRHTRYLRLFRISIKSIPGKSPENLRKIVHQELEMSNVNQILVRKSGN